MTESKYIRNVEKNIILRDHYDDVMDEADKQVIDDNIIRLIKQTKGRSKSAKLGRVGALEILYELGRLLNTMDD